VYVKEPDRKDKKRSGTDGEFEQRGRNLKMEK
jgi:hypothetical protein